jgi:hypothetical protein
MTDQPRIAELRRRLSADPRSLAFAALAEEYRRAGMPAEAVAACLAGLTHHPAYLSARVTLGRSLLELGDPDAAREELERAVAAAPENLAARRSLAEAVLRLGRRAEALEHYLRAAHLAPQDATLGEIAAVLERELSDEASAEAEASPAARDGEMVAGAASMIGTSVGCTSVPAHRAVAPPCPSAASSAPGAEGLAGDERQPVTCSGVALAWASVNEVPAASEPNATGFSWRWPFRLVKSARGTGPYARPEAAGLPQGAEATPPEHGGHDLVLNPAPAGKEAADEMSWDLNAAPAREPDPTVTSAPECSEVGVAATSAAAPGSEAPGPPAAGEEAANHADPAGAGATSREQMSLERFLAAIRRERHARSPTHLQ